MEIKNLIHIEDEIMPYPMLSSFIKWIAKNPDMFKQGQVTNGIDQKIDTEVRKVSNAYLDPGMLSQTGVHWFNFLSRTIFNIIGNYRQKLNIPSVEINGLTEVTILKYENSGFYKPHTDHCSGSPRTLSVVLFLNNDYEGGELVFKSLDYQKDILTVDVKPNRAVIFPSNFMFPHTVKPVSKGTRYAVVSWAL